MKLSTRTGINCPNCKTEQIIVTKGLLGNFIGHSLMKMAIKKLKKTGGVVVCKYCKTKFLYHDDNVYSYKKKDTEDALIDLLKSFQEKTNGKR